ncbi:MAG: PaaI family thioesterase [Ketobacter sp.]|nr:MAG: PaaI family thioesterase [Ketobacter sp.]
MSTIPEGFDGGGFAPYSDHCGPIRYKRETLEDGSIRGWAGVMLQEHHIGGNNRGHGGLLMTILDEALGMNACISRNMQPAVTVSMNTQFFAPMTAGQFLMAYGKVTHATTSMAFMEGEAWCGDILVGKASGVWKYLKPR